MRVAEAVGGGEPPGRILESGEREHDRDVEAGQVSLAALEERSAETGVASLGRDAYFQGPRSLCTLVLDCRGRPARKRTIVLGGPVAAGGGRGGPGGPKTGDT